MDLESAMGFQTSDAEILKFINVLGSRELHDVESEYASVFPIKSANFFAQNFTNLPERCFFLF